jgi:hypothetical protein
MAWRLGAVLTAAVCTLAGCGADVGPQSAASRPDKEASPPTQPRPTAVDPQTVDNEVEFSGFVAPSGNVSCMITADYARCDIIDRDWSPPPRPADCEFDYGQGIAVASGEPAQFVCAGDTTFGPDEVLQYGEAKTSGAMRCDSAESGITCRDVASGHGFTLSMQAYRLF